MKLLVDKDWASSCLWFPSAHGWANNDQCAFDLPADLLDRCEYMSAWFESYIPGSAHPEPDWNCYHAYALALAIDLKRHYGMAAQMFVWHEGRIVEITGRFESMTGIAPQPD